MKNKKLKLGDLKVQSFVTSMGANEKQTIEGGTGWHCLIGIIEGGAPSRIGSGGICTEYCPPEPEVANPWCTEGGAEACVKYC